MNYADYKRFDFLNGTGIRHSLFVSGCHFHCKGCWNAVAWNPNFGQLYTDTVENKIIEDLNLPEVNVQGLSLLGGEPFDHPETLTKLVKRVNQECAGKDIWCWTGFQFEDLLHDPKRREMLNHIDVLVDGQFDITQRNLKLKFRGSSNQRVINVKKSIKEDQIVLQA
ncbi:anaerobic ribonucleoside-triphosphate reductase activating protein [Sporolactobacillus laevolacticus]|uniref:Anaerobic ribonucleoside-triphosphate reductase-activating protein n=1 Tax=Sporolactobacillus laevolacticus DSM 442 TaxID=1395513 RepID=V6IZQ9_9BACL|nr:anaerobic ribonucleoside-triphosphate reductase activating protein [Sporolactobacillus laevolacticus]EST12331.1 anaerobic ribonucleotide reductase-activating protein [Sporolactobacillus laevolacticus DSM 442]